MKVNILLYRAKWGGVGGWGGGMRGEEEGRNCTTMLVSAG